VKKKKEEKKEVEMELDECIVCMAAQVSTMFMPCGHQHLCRGCAEAIKSKQGMCPYCRSQVQNILAIFGL